MNARFCIIGFSECGFDILEERSFLIQFAACVLSVVDSLRIFQINVNIFGRISLSCFSRRRFLSSSGRLIDSYFRDYPLENFFVFALHNVVEISVKNNLNS
jgi:hypothetical protein